MTTTQTNGELHKPSVLDPNFDTMPDELKEMKVWLVWKLEFNDGATKPWTKVPYAEKGGGVRRASSTDPTTWRSFETARFVFEHSDYDGVGIVLRDDIVGIDLDNCRNPTTGELSKTAQLIVSTVNSYTEVSPSGTGVKILCRAPVPGPRNKNQEQGIELYHQKSPRYFTITGHHLEGTPTTIAQRKTGVEDVYRWYLQPLEEKPPKKKTALPAANGNVALDEIIAVASAASNAEKFCRLWEGQWAGGHLRSQSEADLALCSILSFTMPRMDSALIDRLHFGNRV